MIQAYTPVDMVLACARALDFVQEQPHGSNAGQGVEAMQRVTNNRPGDPWCASDVAKVGTSALGLAWPLPLTGSVQALAAFAKKREILFEAPHPGDVFVLWMFVTAEKRWRFAHTGFVETVAEGKQCTTWEGNTSGPGSREGFGHFNRKRTFGPSDRFIRWTLLL